MTSFCSSIIILLDIGLPFETSGTCAVLHYNQVKKNLENLSSLHFQAFFIPLELWKKVQPIQAVDQMWNFL